MAYTPPLFEKTYTVKNAEVVGYCRLSNLAKTKYGYNYQLGVLVDEKIATSIQEDIDKAMSDIKDTYGETPKEFARISKFKKIVKDKETRKILERIPCPDGKMFVRLDTNPKEKNGVFTRLVHLFDAKNNPVKDIDIREGSRVNVNFKISSYSMSAGVGLSMLLKYVQIIELVTPELEKCESPFDKEEGGFNIKDHEDEYTDAEENTGGDDEEEI